MKKSYSRYRRLVDYLFDAASEVIFGKRNFRNFYDYHSLGSPQIYFQIKLSPSYVADCCRGVTKAMYFCDAQHMRTVAPRLFPYFFRDKSISVVTRLRLLCVYGSLPEVVDERYIKKGYVRRGNGLQDRNFPRVNLACVFPTGVSCRFSWRCASPARAGIFDVNDYKVTGTLRHSSANCSVLNASRRMPAMSVARCGVSRRDEALGQDLRVELNWCAEMARLLVCRYFFVSVIFDRDYFYFKP